MQPRESWGSRLGLLMATAGSAVGLGSLWKFPYVAGENGGGLFVLAYIFFTFFIGVPIFIAEMMIGKAAASSPVLAYEAVASKKGHFRYIGWSSVLVSLLILSFYVVVAGWSINYTLLSLLDVNKSQTKEQIASIFDTLTSAGDINLLLATLFLSMTTAIVYKGVRAGIELWSKILMPLLFAMLLALFFYSMTLSGAKEAFFFIFTPDSSKLKVSSFLSALGLACFTLSVGMGILVTYGSYMKKSEDIPKTTCTIAIIDIFVSLLAALMIFPIIFTFHFAPEEGPGLLFKVMPTLFSKLPASLLLSTTFFLLVFFAALTSAISVMEVLVATMMELFALPRSKSSLLIAAIVFLLAIPTALSSHPLFFKNWPVIYGKSFFETIAFFTDNIMLPLNATLTSLFAGWVFNREQRRQAFKEGSKLGFLFSSWLFLVRFVVPIAVILILLEQSGLINIDKLLP